MTGCGGIIKKLNVSITPPKFGNRYVNDGDCKWIIVAPLGYLVQLTFTSFEMEEHDDCRFDYLSVYDNIINQENGSRPIGKYCGSSTPPTIMSSSRALTLFFKSDESVGREGFVATYSFIDGRNGESSATSKFSTPYKQMAFFFTFSQYAEANFMHQLELLDHLAIQRCINLTKTVSSSFMLRMENK